MTISAVTIRKSPVNNNHKFRRFRKPLRAETLLQSSWWQHRVWKGSDWFCCYCMGIFFTETSS